MIPRAQYANLVKRNVLGRNMCRASGKKSIGGKLYDARSSRRSSPGSLAFEPVNRRDDRAD